MIKQKIKNNYWLLLSFCIVFALIFIFFTIVYPIVPYDSDDWLSLGPTIRQHSLPDARAWNPSRIFPEVLSPIAGLFAAYIINPFLGDYLTSISITIALLLAIITTIFYWSLYRLFLSLSNNKMISISLSLLVLCIYFIFFKTQEFGSQYMLHAASLCTYFYYTIPNVLNSILVCVLMRYSVQGISINIKQIGRKPFSVMIVALYFSIFSVLYSAIILAIYCFFEFIFNSIILKEKIIKNLLLLIILVGVLVYMVFEFTGARAGHISQPSFFSIEYLKQCRDGLRNFRGLLMQINMRILLITIGIILFALCLLVLNMAKDKNKPIMKVGSVSLLCFISLTPILIIVTGRSMSYHTSFIQYMYSIFFYYILFVALSLIYIFSKFKKLVIILPFFLILLFVDATNSNRPYRSQADYAYAYFGSKLSTQQKINLNNKWIEQIKYADKNGAESVTIIIPESSYPEGWPIFINNNGLPFSKTLYAHGITSRMMKIIFQPDRQMIDEL